jgi:hypothetical protein
MWILSLLQWYTAEARARNRLTARGEGLHPVSGG